MVKSLSETHPALGLASTPEDDQWKVEGSEHDPPGVAVGAGVLVRVAVAVAPPGVGVRVRVAVGPVLPVLNDASSIATRLSFSVMATN